MIGGGHAFFTLPPELHTHIFMLACTPNSTTEFTACPSYYTASYTGIALSRVSRYIRAASAPARHRAVVIYGWREMLVFEHILSSQMHSHVRYLTLVADELPQDSGLLLSEYSSPALSPRSSLQPCHKANLERMLLEVIARILRNVGNDLYELEIGFQAIENVQDPLAYLSFTGPNLPLFFPCLNTMFYACPPSNAFPWGMTSQSQSTPAINMNATASESSTTIPMPNLSCPHLKELTVVCNDSTTNFRSEVLSDQISDDVAEEGTEEDTESREPLSTERTQESEDIDVKLSDSETNDNRFPSLRRLTLLASTPAQALAALDVEEGAWDVGSNFRIDVDELKRNITGTANSENLQDRASTEGSTLSEVLQTVILRPKTRWNERWESLRDVARRQREAEIEQDVRDDDATGASESSLELLVLKPGEQF
ncbi:hypothetical protein J3R30DRAFT_3408117 [Lentinula aciculospora]|uniref:Uncharacterized protein n=1 Tax=Lentinula aciculospora TaxID=153920 RepID=A0A9W8ZZP0_9AGAR|nr:hypothetical protein J3R30DRAFT_3408117 [Lentinula aciculospora]